MVYNLDLDLLRTFVSIAEAETFAAASQRVHRTQSAVTQQMQRLEAQIGLALFVKRGRGKQLTEAGLRLLDYARRMIVLNDEAIAATRAADAAGRVRLGAPHDSAESFLPALLARFAKSHPNIEMEIRTGRSPFLMQELRNGEIDLTISTRSDPTLASVVLRTSPTIWLCAADYVYHRDQPVPLVVPDEASLFRQLAVTALDQARLGWRISYLALNLGAIKAAVRAGLGITARTVEMISPDLRVLGEAEGLPPLPNVSFYLHRRPDNANRSAEQLFTSL